MKFVQFLLCSACFLAVSTASMAQEDTKEPLKRDVTRLSEDYFIPGRFAGKTILITGGARGIGKSTATRAVKEGANVIIMDWLKEAGQETTDLINQTVSSVGGGKALFVQGDISKPEDCDRAVQAAVDNFGKLDYAVLNAGIMDGCYSGEILTYDEEQKKLLPASIVDATDEYWKNVFKTNAEGSFYSLRSTLRQLLEQRNGGSVVLVGSIAGMTGLAGNPAYVASKHAVNGLTRNAAIDYAPYGIRVNSVNMAETLTPMVRRAGYFVQAEMHTKKSFGMGGIKTQSLLKHCDSEKRGSMAWEQASNILYLISDEASAITGLVMATDGGWTDF
ncbi:MAG: SDR family NAD(P)-dependent oxidoreductase [Phocaeicola sp.]